MGLLSGWRDRVTGWNRSGVNWRRMSAIELVWLAHAEHFEYLARHHKTQVREYLSAADDVDRLRAWDSGSFNEIGGD